MNHEIVMRDVETLIPYARNARTHSPAQVAQIMGSIKEFGFTAPVLIHGNGILAGHGRVQAARGLGMAQVPTIDLSHLTKTQARAYILADNQLALDAGWEAEMLALELTELKDEGFDLDLLGFDDLDELMSPEDAGGLAPGVDEDAVPEAPKVAITKPGDVITLGRHRLMCGDSTVITDVERLMDGAKADMVFTDPPYGVEYQSNMRTKSAKFDVIKNDDVELDVTPVIERFSTGWVFIWTTWKVVDKWLSKTSAIGFPSNMVVWHKGGGGMGDLKGTFSTDWELALVFNRGAEIVGKRIGSVWSIGKDAAGKYVHPTQKPVALGQEAIEKTTHPSATVLDLFGGSGSTMIACEKTGRIARLMELDPIYCDVIVTRWEQATGKKATRP